MRTSYILVLLPALAGAALGAFAYLGPDTGVDGTAGALLALIGAVAVSLGALIVMMAEPRGWAFRTLVALMGLGAVLTAVAAYFLMQYLFAAAMVLAVLGLILAVAIPTRRRTA